MNASRSPLRRTLNTKAILGGLLAVVVTGVLAAASSAKTYNADTNRWRLGRRLQLRRCVMKRRRGLVLAGVLMLRAVPTRPTERTP